MRAIPSFATAPAIDGYDVIDVDTGRPVDHRDTLVSANGVAHLLNSAARAGTKALCAALAHPGSRYSVPSDPLGLSDPSNELGLGF